MLSREMSVVDQKERELPLTVSFLRVLLQTVDSTLLTSFTALRVLYAESPNVWDCLR